MSQPVTPKDGVGVLHLFGRVDPELEPSNLVLAIEKAQLNGAQVIPVAVLGHKADLALMVICEDLWVLRDCQTGVALSGVKIVDSYLSLTEISEYAIGISEEMMEARLYPQLPPAGKPAWCFYPMSKRRGESNNWFTLPFEERSELMREHGFSGRAFSGRIVQLITASTGIDDFEWGVTLFGQRPDDLKDVVYSMRYDRASAVYAEFGPFYMGLVSTLEEILQRLGH